MLNFAKLWNIFLYSLSLGADTFPPLMKVLIRHFLPAGRQVSVR